MKIATYNVWYEHTGVRVKQLREEIERVDADVIGLQEVPQGFYEQLAGLAKYAHSAFSAYDGEMGLALFSKYPILEQVSLVDSVDFGNSIAQNVVIEADGIKFSVTNVHLPWDSVLAKEKQIVAIDSYIHAQKDKAHFFILLGDFNCGLNSSVHRYLLGGQTLLSAEAKPYWNDLSAAHAALNGYDALPTLDFVNNPRWRGKNTKYVPENCDRIYIMESFNWDYAFELRDVSVFGKEVSPETGYAPSDHYGLLAGAEFSV